MNTDQVSLSDVSAFLEKAKKLMAAGKYVFVPRRKNMQALSAYGFTIADAKDEIIGLVVGNYYKGPKQDFDPTQPGDIWEFKKNIDGKEFYIKLKIQNRNRNDILKCLSFHEDDFG
ncbi:MAG: type II toxin-antitoxin system MqsR family toxin [Lachnospiraceae bacterium]|nr:type II toxin-antitoxin system MqsR family toxin [Lachnospiraceae bacterium]